MNFGGFSSLFELFVVFNFIYFGSEEFRFTLVQTIHRGEQALQNILNSSESIYTLLISESKDGEKKIGETFELFVHPNERKETLEKLIRSRSKFEIEKNKLLADFDKNCIIKSFSKYCLLAGLFSLSILILIGIMQDISDRKAFLLNDYIIITSMILLACLMGGIFNDTIYPIGVKKIKTFYLLILYSLIILGGCISFYLGHTFLLESKSATARPWAIGLSIIAVSIHFIIYLCRYFGVYNSKRKATLKLNEKVKNDVKKIDPFLLSLGEAEEYVSKFSFETISEEEKP